jgi:metal-responsive CopG/Arc/MetJ family transcriptional regulator
METVTINLSMPRDFLKEVDELARQEMTTRSDLIRKSIVNMRKAAAARQRREDKLLESAIKQLEESTVSDQEVLDYIMIERRKAASWRTQK